MTAEQKKRGGPREPQKEPEEKEEEAELKVSVSLGGLFKGVGGLMDLVAKTMEEGTPEISRTGRIEGLPRGAKGVYGVTIRSGIGGIPTVERFGNIRETERGPVVEEVREPIIDVFDEEDTVLVVAELPGVNKSDINLAVKDNSLVIEAHDADRKYEKNIRLPAPVDASGMRSSYKNGILEVTLPKRPKA